MIEELLLSDGDKSIEFSDCSDPGLVSALIEMENYDSFIGWYLDTGEAIKVRDWLSAVIERATGKAAERAVLRLSRAGQVGGDPRRKLTREGSSGNGNS